MSSTIRIIDKHRPEAIPEYILTTGRILKHPKPFYTVIKSDKRIYAYYFSSRNTTLSEEEFQKYTYFLRNTLLIIKKKQMKINDQIYLLGEEAVDSQYGESRPFFLFYNFPFLCVCDYSKSGHMFLLHQYTNIERRPDVFHEIVRDYLNKHPGCKKKKIDREDTAAAVNTHHHHILSNSTLAKINPPENDKILPDLPYNEGRCLWCGNRLMDIAEEKKQRFYCKYTSCETKDRNFSRIFREKLSAANQDYVLHCYKHYLSIYGEYGAAVDLDDIKERTVGDLISSYDHGAVPHQLVMSWIRGPCRKCGRKIPLDKRTDAIYCDDCAAEKIRENKRKCWYSHKGRYTAKKD